MASLARVLRNLTTSPTGEETPTRWPGRHRGVMPRSCVASAADARRKANNSAVIVDCPLSREAWAVQGQAGGAILELLAHRARRQHWLDPTGGRLLHARHSVAWY